MIKTRLLALLAVAAFVAGSGVARADDVHVVQKDKQFAPGEVTLKSGDSIVFHNDDAITHNMFSRSDGHKFNLKMQKPGQDMSQQFDQSGEAVVRCAIHPKMKLRVKVEE